MCAWDTVDATIVKRRFAAEFDRKKPPSLRGFPIYYAHSSRTVSKRIPLEEFVPVALRGVLLLTVLDEGT